jgi:hypothetical protein
VVKKKKEENEKKNPQGCEGKLFKVAAELALPGRRRRPLSG